jgi:hypothetical protein
MNLSRIPIVGVVTFAVPVESNGAAEEAVRDG